jgi:hypothetical protein
MANGDDQEPLQQLSLSSTFKIRSKRLNDSVCKHMPRFSLAFYCVVVAPSAFGLTLGP